MAERGGFEYPTLNISYPNQPRHGAKSAQSSDTEEARDDKVFEVFHADGFNQKVSLDLDRGISLSVTSLSGLCAAP